MWRLTLFITALLFSISVKAADTCNYWFLYIYNNYSNPISYSVSSNYSGSESGPNSGTINTGGGVTKIYFGNTGSGKEAYTGGSVELKDATTGQTIGQIVTSGSDSNMEAGCFFDSYLTLETGFKGCGYDAQEGPTGPCNECIPTEAEASGIGDGSSSTSGQGPAVAYTICDN
jgi:hypothetical protein